MATELAERTHRAPLDRLGAVKLAVLLALAVAAVVLAVDAGSTGLMVLAVGLAALGGFLLLRHSFAAFLAAAVIARPLVDLTADARGTGIGVTEIFGVAVLAVCAGWLYLNRGVLWRRARHPLTLTLLAFVVVLLLATAGSASPAGSLPVVVRVVAGVAVFLAMDVLLATRRMTLRSLVGVLLAAALIPLVFPVMGLLGVPVTHVKDEVTALKSVFFLSNNFAHFLVPYVIVATAWVAHARRHLLFAWALLGVAVVELLLTQTRGAWIAAVSGILVVGMLVRRTVLGVVLGVSVLAVLLIPPVQERVTNLIPDPDDPRTVSSLAWRLGHWADLIPMVGSSPLLGIGPGESARITGKEPHNDLVRALVEGGIVGFVVYAWLLVQAVLLARRVFSRLKEIEVVGSRVQSAGSDVTPRGASTRVEPEVVALVAGLTGYVAAFALAALAENLIDNVTLLWALMPILAILRWAHDAPAEELTLERNAGSARSVAMVTP